MLSRNRLGDEGATLLCAALRDNRALTHLSISDCGVGAASIKSIHEGLMEYTLTEAEVQERTDLEVEAAEELGKAASVAAAAAGGGAAGGGGKKGGKKGGKGAAAGGAGGLPPLMEIPTSEGGDGGGHDEDDGNGKETSKRVSHRGRGTKRLAVLDLSGNPIGVDGVASLVQTLAPPPPPAPPAEDEETTRAAAGKGKDKGKPAKGKGAVGPGEVARTPRGTPQDPWAEEHTTCNLRHLIVDRCGLNPVLPQPLPEPILTQLGQIGVQVTGSV